MQTTFEDAVTAKPGVSPGDARKLELYEEHREHDAEEKAEKIEEEMEAHGGLLPVQELDGMSEAEVKDMVAAAQAAAKAEALAVEEERRRVEAMPDLSLIHI